MRIIELLRNAPLVDFQWVHVKSLTLLHMPSLAQYVPVGPQQACATCKTSDESHESVRKLVRTFLSRQY